MPVSELNSPQYGPSSARLKAWTLLAGFTLLGLVVLLTSGPPSPLTLPDAIVYFTIVLNSFFSIGFFDARLSMNTALVFTDGGLTAIFVLLALTLGSPVAYPFFVTCLFAGSIARYAPSLGHHMRLDAVVRRKIKVMVAATGLAGVSLTLAIAGYPRLGAWVGVFTNTTGNVYLLLIDPLYRMPGETSGNALAAIGAKVGRMLRNLCA